MLKVLPPNISNLIAAGEVVSRPASAIKELMENAVDAGASSVSVFVVDAGRTMLQVIDDGVGMSPEDAELCFERHATSKISEAEDLEHISTFGFRGEALASIAAVAEVTLRTRRRDDQVGTRVLVASSKLISREEVSTPRGSNFEIRNLFYNVPARRKFLKSDSAELKHIVSEFTRVALTRYGIAMRLTSNGKDIYNLRAVANIKQRISDIFGRDLTGGLTDISTTTSVVKVSGFIGDPKDARKAAGQQFLFINGRYFRSPFLNKAICKPYEKLIPEGYVPTYFIFLETAADKVDVNIHPAKTEVKFADESMVFEILMACVREALGRNSMVPDIDFDTQGAMDIPTIGSTRNGGYVAPPKIDYDPLFNPFDSKDGFEREIPQSEFALQAASLFEEAKDSGVPVIQFKGRYIFTPVQDGVMVVNITRARERIFYERYLESLAEQQPLRQQALFPQTVKLQRADYITLKGELERVGSMGFDIQDFGEDCVVVYGLPEGYSTDKKGVDKIVADLVAAIAEEDVTEDFRTMMARKMARSAALSRGGVLSQSESRSLVDALLACREPSLTPDGHRCYTVITLEELDRKI